MKGGGNLRQVKVRNTKPIDKRKFLFEKFNGICPKCGRKLSLKNPKSKSYLTLDHIVPKSMGGTNNLENLQPLCAACNYSKANNMEGVRARLNERFLYVSQDTKTNERKL